MKSISKCISILLLIVFINSGTHAQNLGIRVGLNASNLSVKNFDDRKNPVGFQCRFIY